MGIHKAIAAAKVDYILKTGIEPTRVYLGDEEITALLSWAREQQYIFTEPNETEIEGDHRPEVSGLFVYVVNDKSHLQCA
jgi:hypothetical protein